ncbi:hypothetical protein [Streptomyces albicerus]|uniref:hypothetical protein n=1 Tax=Streptomyces albicerus TaxID=2569859 RepID=UPI00124B5C2C|nr:hypothetical protein [Streptomyces albicerus]
MRVLPTRRIAASALCTALVLGAAGTALATAPDSEGGVARTVSRAPVPRAEALLGQTEALGDLGTVLTPATNLLNTVLKADNGQLSKEEAKKLGDATKGAIAQAKDKAKAPAQPPGTSPSASATSPVKLLPADLRDDQLDALGKAVDALLGAVTSGKADQVEPAVENVVTALVNVSAATLLGSEMRAADLPGLPPS